MSRASTCSMASDGAGHRGGADHLGNVHPRRPQFVGGDGAVAEHLHVGLGVPAERIAVDDGGEAPDDAVVEHAVDTPLDRRCGQVHPLADLGEGGPGMLGELGQNALVGLVQTVHDQ